MKKSAEQTSGAGEIRRFIEATTQLVLGALALTNLFSAEFLKSAIFGGFALAVPGGLKKPKSADEERHR